MSYIAFPSVKATNAAATPASSSRQDAFGEYSTYRRVIRTLLCGLLFAAPLCVAIPASPLMRLSQTNDNKRALVPRMITDFFYINFMASAGAYWCLVEPFIPNPKGKEGFAPYLGPLTAQIPALSCLFASHLFYPGLWAIFNEATWPLRRREFVRLNLKCFFAFGSVHIPAAMGLGVVVGSLLYPFKFMKLRAQYRIEAAAHTSSIQ